MNLQTLDESGAAQVRLNPGAETLLKLLGLIQLTYRFTQLNQYSNGIVIPGAHSMFHCLIDLLPVLLLMILNILQTPHVSCSLAFALLIVYPTFYSLPCTDQRVR